MCSLRRDGNTLVVHVVENPIINQVAFEGNHRLDDDQLRGVVQLAPRAVYTRAGGGGGSAAHPRPLRPRGRFAATVSPRSSGCRRTA